MCGRSAQRLSAVNAAAESLAAVNSNASSVTIHMRPKSSTPGEQGGADLSPPHNIMRRSDNFNMSPGMDALVFMKDDDADKSGDGSTYQSGVKIASKVWGLVTRPGTKSKPLDLGMGRHFSNLMFNARSDTLYSKPTFARLANSGKTCVVALDGFFEWKSALGGRKEPYFVYRRERDVASKKRPYLLVAGLWTSVDTGKTEGKRTLDTYTLLTTDVCKPLEWLHDRMPVCIWDEDLAMEWLLNPSPELHQKLAKQATESEDGVFQWHAVTPEMSKTKFRSSRAIQALPKLKTVKSFFSPKKNTPKDEADTAREGSDERKHRQASNLDQRSTKRLKTAVASSQEKRKGTIYAFFKPKAK